MTRTRDAFFVARNSLSLDTRGASSGREENPMNTAFDITLTDYAKTFIRLKARRLIGHYGFTQSDRDDIERELMLDLLARLVHFDTEKGRLVTFVRVVV